jgi:hypothetical protein
MLDEDQQTAFDLAKDGHNLVVIGLSSFKYRSSPIPDHLCNVVPPNLP